LDLVSYLANEQLAPPPVKTTSSLISIPAIFQKVKYLKRKAPKKTSEIWIGLLF
jgi:hypothetical protein